MSVQPRAVTHSARPSTFIQVFNTYLQRGGEEASVARIASHLELAGHRVHRFWRQSADWQATGAPPKWRQLLLLWNNPAVLGELEALHARVRPAAWVLHNVVPVISLGIYSLARRLNVPILQWLHNYRPISPSSTLSIRGRRLEPDDPWLIWKEILAGTWRGRLLTAWLALGYARVRRRGDFEAVRAWVAVSDDLKQTFLKAGWPASRVFTLRHSWDFQTPAPAERDEGYFLFLGRMVETKGVRFLVELWKDPALRDVPLVMAGDGPLFEELKNTAPPNVRWVGFVQGEEKLRLVGGCRAILFPCLWAEPLSTVTYEAYQQAKPILSSALGGMREVIRDGETGRLLPAAEDRSWLEAITAFARDAAMAQRLGLAGRRWLDDNVSLDAWSRQFDEIVEKALKR